MADVWVNAFTVVTKSSWTPEMKQRIGESVLNALWTQWQLNSDLEPPEDIIEYMKAENHKYIATITVRTS
jgi:hypothetical protein